MSTGSIRQKLHSYLEVADDKKVKVMYIMLEENIKGSSVEYTEELKEELDKRYADYKNGKAKIITSSESKSRIEKVLKSGRKK